MSHTDLLSPDEYTLDTGGPGFTQHAAELTFDKFENHGFALVLRAYPELGLAALKAALGNHWTAAGGKGLIETTAEGTHHYTTPGDQRPNTALFEVLKPTVAMINSAGASREGSIKTGTSNLIRDWRASKISEGFRSPSFIDGNHGILGMAAVEGDSMATIGRGQGWLRGVVDIAEFELPPNSLLLVPNRWQHGHEPKPLNIQITKPTAGVQTLCTFTF